MKYNILHLSKR